MSARDGHQRQEPHTASNWQLVALWRARVSYALTAVPRTTSSVIFQTPPRRRRAGECCRGHEALDLDPRHARTASLRAHAILHGRSWACTNFITIHLTKRAGEMLVVIDFTALDSIDRAAVGRITQHDGLAHRAASTRPNFALRHQLGRSVVRQKSSRSPIFSALDGALPCMATATERVFQSRLGKAHPDQRARGAPAPPAVSSCERHQRARR
jgi:hypothetical protein